jgi:hypothetical protein
MSSKSPRSSDECMDAARMRGECENERHKKKLADLEKAKILLAWACRVYGPDMDAEEPEYNQFLQIGCAIANITRKTLAHVSIDEVVAYMLAEDRLEADRLLAPPQRDRGRPATPHKHVWIMGTIEAYIGAGLKRKAAIHRAATHWELGPSTIDKIYKDNKLAKSESKQIRAFFDADTPEDVDKAIRRHRGYDPSFTPIE